MRPEPIIIISYPRSGSTLLRVLLGSHPLLLGLPETPWISGGYGTKASLRRFVEDLIDHPAGLLRNAPGLESKDVYEAARALIDVLLERIKTLHGKEQVVIKTPDDIHYIDFMVQLFPDAFFVHLIRDGRDNALSHLRSRKLFFPGARATFEELLSSWAQAELHAQQRLKALGARCFSLRYENLVEDPERHLRAICDFAEIPYDPRMLQYDLERQILPQWEAGSTDVRSRTRIDVGSIGRWKDQLGRKDVRYGLYRCQGQLRELGYDQSPVTPDIFERAAFAWYRIMIGSSRLWVAFTDRIRWRVEGIARRLGRKSG